MSFAAVPPAVPLVATLLLLCVLALVFMRQLSERNQSRLISSSRLRVLSAVVALVFVLIVVLMTGRSLSTLEQDTRERAASSLSGVNAMVRQNIERWVNRERRNAMLLATSPTLQAAARALQARRSEFADASEADTAAALSSASAAHAQLQSLFARHARASALRAMLLLDRQGEVLFDSAQAPGGPRLPAAFIGEVAAVKPGVMRLLPGSFGNLEVLPFALDERQLRWCLTVLTPVPGDEQLVLALSLDLNQHVAGILTAARFGQSGETYAFDLAGRLLSPSRFGGAVQTADPPVSGPVLVRDPGGTLGPGYWPVTPPAQWPLTRMAEQATAGIDGVSSEGYRDYRGIAVVGAWSWLDDLGLGIATEIDEVEILRQQAKTRWQLLLAVGTIAALAILLLVFIIWANDRGRLQLRDQLARRNAELRTIGVAVQQSPLSVIATDPQGVILHVNPAFSQITGFSEAEALGQTPRMLKSGVTLTRVYNDLWDTILRGRTWQGEIINRCKNGDLITCHLSVTPVFDPTGQITHFVGILEDISERKLAEQRIAQSEDRLTATAEAAHLGLWEFLPGGERSELIVNTRFAEMLGYPPQQLRRGKGQWSRLRDGLMTMVELSHPDDLGTVNRVLRQALRAADGTQVHRAEYRLRCADGEWRWFAAIGRVLDRDARGRVRRMAGVQVDIQAERSLQAALLAAREEAEAAARAKSEFLANMSHEIRTPMNAILGMAQLVLSTQLDEKQRECLLKLQQSAHGLLDIINDILDFSRIESGRLRMERVAFSVAEVLESLNSLVGLYATEKGVRLRFELGQTVPEPLLGDPTRLRQVLLNLVNNAVKFTGRGGEVVVRAERSASAAPVSGAGPEPEAQGHSAGCMLHFSVRDNGIGMSREQQGRLFQPFSQADSSITRRYGGSGLGLAICNTLVDMMGGRIWVDSEPGVGSVFHFSARFELPEVQALSAVADTADRLAADPERRHRGDATASTKTLAAVENPAKNKDLYALPVDGPAARQLRGAHILLVEDNEINQQVASELLGACGIHVDIAEHGEAALQWLAAAEYDGVLMDCQMPVMDGYAATRAIRAQPQFANLPIIAMTAEVMSGDRERALAAGMNDHVGKPVNLSDLLFTMARWITPAQPQPATADVPETVSDRAKTDSVRGQPLLGLIPGVVIDRALALLQGDEKLLRRVFSSFARANREFEAQCVMALDAGDWAAAERLAHTLKGTAANIAAEQVTEIAAALEQACAALGRGEGGRSEVDQQLQRLREPLEQVVSALESLEPAVATSDSPVAVAGDAGSIGLEPALRTQLAALLGRLSDNDIAALEQLEAYLPQLRGAGHEDAAQGLSDAAARYDFSMLVQQIRALLAG